MPVVVDRRHWARLRWYHGRPVDVASPALRDPGRHGCWVLQGGVELDAARMPRFRELLDRAVGSGARVVVLDLRCTEFLSIRVAALLGVAKADAWAHGVDIRLLTRSREVERALNLAGVRPLFRYYLSIDEASGSESAY